MSDRKNITINGRPLDEYLDRESAKEIGELRHGELMAIKRPRSAAIRKKAIRNNSGSRTSGGAVIWKASDESRAAEADIRALEDQLGRTPTVKEMENFKNSEGRKTLTSHRLRKLFGVPQTQILRWMGFAPQLRRKGLPLTDALRAQQLAAINQLHSEFDREPGQFEMSSFTNVEGKHILRPYLLVRSFGSVAKALAKAGLYARKRGETIRPVMRGTAFHNASCGCIVCLTSRGEPHRPDCRCVACRPPKKRLRSYTVAPNRPKGLDLDWVEVQRARDSGESTYSIAKRLGISTSTVRSHSIAPERAQRPSVDWAEVQRARDSGESTCSIAKRLGIPKTTICRHTHKSYCYL